jgi:hypothetical protein
MDMPDENPYRSPVERCHDAQRLAEMRHWILDRVALVVTASVILAICMLLGLWWDSAKGIPDQPLRERIDTAEREMAR